MKRYILNSAVITTPGTHSYAVVSIDKMKEWLKAAPFESTIGYPDTAEALSMLTGIDIDVKRKTIRMDAGDEALVFRLTQRVELDKKGSLSVRFIMNHHEAGILRKIQ